jgi:hypothetical protein
MIQVSSPSASDFFNGLLDPPGASFETPRQGKRAGKIDNGEHCAWANHIRLPWFNTG